MLSHIHHKGVGHQGFLFHHTVTERPQSTIKSDPLLFSLHEKTGAFTFHLGFQCVISVLTKNNNNNNNKKGKTPYPRSPNLGAVGSTQEIFTQTVT